MGMSASQAAMVEQRKKVLAAGAIPQAQTAQVSQVKPATPTVANTTKTGYAPAAPVATPSPTVNKPVLTSTVSNRNGGVAIPSAMAGTVKANQTQSGGYIPPSSTPNMNQSTSAYFDKHHGGADTYASTQNQRYADAHAAGDQDLISRLNADAARVGYTLNAPKAAEVQVQGAIPQMAQPTGDAVTNVRTSGELQTQSGDSLAIERAALKNAIDTQMASVKNSAEYANKLTNDGRVLQDFTRTQTANPFANMGKTSFNEGLVGRQRSIDDSSRNSETQNQLNNLSTEIANFDKLAPERQREIYNELLALERTFGLNQAQVTGQYAGNQTLAAKTADQNYQLGLSGLSGKLPFSAGGGQTLQARGQTFDQNMATKQFTRANFESDREYDFAKTQQEWSNMFNTKQFNESTAARLWDQTFKDKSFAQSVKDEAAGRGLQWASLNQRDKEFVADQAYREKTFSYQKEQDELKNMPKYQRAEDYYSYIDSSPSAFVKDGTDTIQNNSIIESMILNSGLSPAEMTKLYNRYGVPMK